MVDPDVVKKLQLPNSAMYSKNLSVTTVEGTTAAEPCKVIDNLQVTDLDNHFTRTLPSTFVHKPLPDVLHEVPSQTKIAEMQGLRHLAGKFHEKKRIGPRLY